MLRLPRLPALLDGLRLEHKDNMNNLLSYLEERKTQLEKEIQRLENEKKQTSRKVSVIQAAIIGLTGELNNTKEIIKKIKEEK